VRDKGAVRAYRSVANQRWYNAVRTSLKPYHTTIGDRRGARSLLWAEPVIIVSAGGKKRFGGAVAVKVDLLECFQQVAAASEYPFRVLAGGAPLFAHRWESDMDYDEAAVEVRGLDNVVVCEVRRSPERAPVPVSDFGDTAHEGVVGEADSVAADTSVRHDALPHRLPVGRVVFSLLAAAAAAAFVRSRIRHHGILRQVLRETGPE
jgi:hypothetical protein